MSQCPDCDVMPGEPHRPGCDVERCSWCGGQAISCDCEISGIPHTVWSGEWPGKAECREYGFYCLWVDGVGWVRCDKDTPGAVEDLNHLVRVCVWDRDKQKWVPRG